MKNILFLIALILTIPALAQNESALLDKVRARLDKVKDYQATGTMKIDVSFINAPESKVTVLYKQPNKFRIRKADGISLLPKGGVSINLSSLVPAKDFTVVPAGTANLNGTAVRVVKLLPSAENSDVVLTTLYIDEKNAVIRKSVVTTKDNGTYEMELQYGKYINWGLPDQVTFHFNTKDYKLPKGITFEYEKGGKKNTAPRDTKGTVKIVYDSYTINKGIADSAFD